MGQLCTLPISRGGGDKHIAIVGLEGAGKTAVLYKLLIGELVTTVPTIGFNVETVRYKGTSFVCWDIGASEPRNRQARDDSLTDLSGVIFVVDSSDPGRLPEASRELQTFLAHPNFAGIPLLVLANKQDRPGALSASEITHHMDLHRLRARWYIKDTSAPTGDGLFEGLDWLHQVLQESRP